MNARDHLLRKHSKSGLPADKVVYKRKRNLVNQLLKKTKNEYGKNLQLESAGKSAKFGFRKKRSTEIAAKLFFDDVKQCNDIFVPPIF